MNLPSFPSLPAWSSPWRAAVVGADLTLYAPHGGPLKSRKSQKTKTGGLLYTDCTKRRRKEQKQDTLDRRFQYNLGQAPKQARCELGFDLNG
jgi:hypothetical protein